MKHCNGRILLRIPPELHELAAEHAKIKEQSLNEYIKESIQNKINEERVGFKVATNLSFSKVSIGDKRRSELREAVIVTQHPWYMELLRKHQIYFFNPKLGRVTPMSYLLFYETTKQEEDGTKNQHPRTIASYGKVDQIIFDINPNDYKFIPELNSLIDDEEFWPRISKWGSTNIVILSDIGEINNTLSLKNGLEARYLVNKTTSLPQLVNAKYIEDLYK
ncbi:toxin-antitoxin system HicB family antitoxin [Cytobacillus sp. IB215316]|uniref:toxin-antitoxin system HicB family antitoxin n=1 Tax=Cytobacillus sp. IB215316 TaxID=3097354 RepID=UPI002A0F83B5|nr:toxin-antitoxin system HicB family antitoxin [Cytobacillus sp. IB215316]MDX8361641.1 toxin-antitoxin system HicB family antitoxin [Cytobacillus sp. IB215316]